MIADPAAELLDLVRALGDPAPAVAPAASQRRAELVFSKILEPLVGPGGGTPMGEHPDFISAVVAAIRSEGDSLDITFS